MTLAGRVPPTGDADAVYDAFSRWLADTGVTPYPHQDEALLELASGSNVVLATPTGSGKTLVATGALFTALATGRRAAYTAPIKALVSEKFFELCGLFGAERVGMLTGDATVNADAPLVVCTAEVLANQALRRGADLDVGVVVMDEFHYYGDPQRGWAWQVPLLELTRAQHLLMSATLGDVDRFRRDLTRRTGRDTAVVTAAERPVPLEFSYTDTTHVHDTLQQLLDAGRAPVYVVHPTQEAAVERAQALMSTNVCTREEKDRIAELIGDFRFTTRFGRVLSRLVRHGVGVHHAGMLPKYRRLVEQLAQSGLLKVVCGTDTLGVGVNVPIRTVLMTSLSKFDGSRQRVLQAREFHQVAGRAGRPGHDVIGYVVAQAPEHVIENTRLLHKAGEDPKRRRKVVRRQAPEGFVGWDEATFQRLVGASPEPLASRFRVSTAMLLNLAQRPDPEAAFRRLVAECDEADDRKRRHTRDALRAFRSLREAGVVERDADGRVRLAIDLQRDFALDQPLSTFAVSALDLLDADADDYALDVLSVLEATLEAPRAVLRAQWSKARGDAVGAMKAEGVEYEERMALLEDVDRPRPLAELLEHAQEVYAQSHPWVREHELDPKAVARDLFERAMSFNEYVAHYGLQRSEGLLLRYLADAYKALRRTVPPERRTEPLVDLTEWLGELVRQVDTSLLDEWEALASGEAPTVVPAGPERAAPPFSRSGRAFRVAVRNAMFRRVELLALRRYDLLEELDGESGWTWQAWADALAPYWAEHDEVRTGADARSARLLLVEESATAWTVVQVLDDPAGHHDWRLTAEVDLPASDEAGEVVLRLLAAGDAPYRPDR